MKVIESTITDRDELSNDAGGQLPVASAAETRKEIRDLARGQWWRIGVIVAVMAGGAAAALVVPATLGAIVDSAIASDPPSVLWRLGGLMLAAAAVGGLLTGLGVVASARLFDTILAGLRERLIKRALTLPQATVEAAGTGDLVSRASDDVAEVGEGITKVLPAFSGAAFTIVLTGFGLAVLDIRYLLALFIVVPVHVIAVRRYLRKAPQIYAAERTAMAARAHELLGSIRGLPTVHAYQLGPDRIASIARRSWAVVRLSMKARIVQNVFFARLNVAEYLGMAALLLTGFVLVGQGAGTVGATTTAMLFFLALFGPIGQLLFVIDDLQSAAASLARIVGVIRCAGDDFAAPDEPGETDSWIAPGRPAEIRLIDVSFGYNPARPVVEHLNLFIPAGQKVALVGASGAGKSTLAALIAGVAPPGSGAILLGGMDSRDMSDDQHAAFVALITQEVHTFAGTLRDDLTLACPSATDVEITGALGSVGADTWVGSLTDGLDTIVGAQGERPTPAQAQQLAMARLVLADPPVAVLDEATAESGSSGARMLEASSTAALRGRTGLVVAHRLSQAAAADRVLVMHAGRIIEDGHHDELVAAGGKYAELWSAWASQRPVHPVAGHR